MVEDIYAEKQCGLEWEWMAKSCFCLLFKEKVAVAVCERSEVTEGEE